MRSNDGIRVDQNDQIDQPDEDGREPRKDAKSPFAHIARVES